MSSKKVVSVTDNFAINQVLRSTDFGLYKKWSSKNRISIMAREIINNSKEFCATKIDMLTQVYNKNVYAHLATDAIPFSSYEHLEKCCQVGISGKTSGFQGSGMKLAMCLGGNKQNMETYIHCRTETESFTVRLSIPSANNYIVERCDEYNEYIKNYYGKYYTNFNIFISYRMMGLSDSVIFNEHNVALLSDLCPTNDIKIYCIPSRKIGDSSDCGNLTYEEARGDSNTRRMECYSEKSRKNSFVVYERTLSVNDAIYKDNRYSDFGIKEKERKYNADIHIEILAGFRDKHSRLINLDKNHQSFNTPVYGVEFSDQTVFVKLGKESILNRCNGKNMNRFYNDPIFSSYNSSQLLNKLGIYGCNLGRNFISKIDNYDIAKNINLKQVKKWSPIAKITITLKEHESNASVKDFDEFLLDIYGGVDAFAYSEDKIFIKNIIESVFDKLSEDNPEELYLLREDMKKHFPSETIETLPIPIDNCSKKVYMYQIKENGMLKPIKEVTPGDFYRNVVLQYKDKTPVTEDIEWASDGFHFQKIGIDTFDLNIDRLSVKKNNKKSKPISYEEYSIGKNSQNSKDFFPNSKCHIIIDNIKYVMNFKCDVPTSKKVTVTPTGGVTGGNGGTDRGRGRPEKEYTYKNYYEGPNGEIGRYNSSSGELEINRSHKVISLIIHSSDDKHGSEASKWYEIYRKLNKKTPKIINSYKQCELHFKRDLEESLFKDYDSEENYYLNTHLNLLLEENQDVVKIIHSSANNIEKIGG